MKTNTERKAFHKEWWFIALIWNIPVAIWLTLLFGDIFEWYQLIGFILIGLLLLSINSLDSWFKDEEIDNLKKEIDSINQKLAQNEIR
jgi:hypothetical protein